MRRRRATRRTSIVDSFHEPAFRSQVFVDAIYCGLFFIFPAVFRLNRGPQRTHDDVPFIARPCSFRPPVAFRSPWPGERQDLSAHSFAPEKSRLTILKLHGRWKWRPENA